jgi:HAD superfamily hydrolase (TIGR01509 family)
MDAILFDYNGVIVNDEPLHFAAFRDVLAAEGIPLDRATYDAEYLGFEDRACFREAFRRSGRPLDPARLDRLLGRKAERYSELARESLPLVPGAAQFVRAAAARAALAVASGALRNEIEFGLELAGIRGVVGAIVSAEDLSAGKPDPGCFRLALERLVAGSGAGPDRAPRAVVIEDSLPGLAAARAIGAGCVMLVTSHPAGKLGGADLVWTSFEGHHPDELNALFRAVRWSAAA